MVVYNMLCKNSFLKLNPCNKYTFRRIAYKNPFYIIELQSLFKKPPNALPCH